MYRNIFIKFDGIFEFWLIKRLQVPPIYTLDCTNLDQWNSCVYEPALAIIEAVLRGEKPVQKPLNETVENEKFTDSSNEERHYCRVKFFLISLIIDRRYMVIVRLQTIIRLHFLLTDLRQDIYWTSSVDHSYGKYKTPKNFEKEKEIGGTEEVRKIGKRRRINRTNDRRKWMIKFNIAFRVLWFYFVTYMQKNSYISGAYFVLYIKMLEI